MLGKNAAMSWEPLARALQTFDEVIAELNVRLAPDSPVASQLTTVRQFMSDRERMSEMDLAVKWTEGDFQPFYDAVIVVGRLTGAVARLRTQPGQLRTRLRQVLSGSLTQDFVPQQAKDYFYELEIAATLLRAGFDVRLREPDIVVSGNGLSRELGLACKYPSREAQLHDHISKGYRQISDQALEGCVVMGLDAIVFNTIFQSRPKCLDFRQGTRHPLDVTNDQTAHAVKVLLQQRDDYPSERPLDGAILTLSMWGLWGKPAGFISVTSWTIQCDATNPILPDVERIVTAARERGSDDVPPRH